MKWSIQELNKFKEQGIDINETIDIKDSLMSRDHDILNVSPVQVTGHLAINKSEYILYTTVNCTVTLPSTRSLEPVDMPLSFVLDEVYMTEEQFNNRTIGDDDDFIMVLEKDYIDLLPVIEDYILLNIPTVVLTEEELNSSELPSGNEWEVISEEEYNKRKSESTEQQVNPQMAKLQEWMDQNN